MPIYVVRHAHAGSRSRWTGDDLDRPLSEKGARQAAGLVGVVGGEPIGAVWSSPARRCVETAQPLADHLGLPVEPTPLLAEGRPAEPVLGFLLERADRNPLAVSHGDVIPKLLRLLTAAGMRADAGNESAKGSVWVLELADGRVERGTYHPPPATG